MIDEQDPLEEKRIRLQIHGRARFEDGRLRELADELMAAVRADEPEVLEYRWSHAIESADWLIEEEYAHDAAFVEHMSRMRSSGRMRRLGEVLEVHHVVVMAPDPELVGKYLGPLDRVVYERVLKL